MERFRVEGSQSARNNSIVLRYSAFLSRVYSTSSLQSLPGKFDLLLTKDRAAPSAKQEKIPFKFHLAIQGLTLLVTATDFKTRLYSEQTGEFDTRAVDVWAGLTTNITAQSYADSSFDFQYSSEHTVRITLEITPQQ